VDRTTVVRWELGERLPSAEELQALCFALGAQDEEIVTLTTGHFAEAPEAMPTEPRAVIDCIHALLFEPRDELVDLRFLTMERTLWQRAARDARAQSLLARTYAEHAHYVSNYERWGEVRTLAERALLVAPQEEPTPDYTLRAVLKLAAVAVHGGNRLAPERGLHLLKSWLPRASEPHYTAWMLSDMSNYLALAGQMESALALGKKAVDAAEHQRDIRQIDYGRLLLAAGRPGEALDHLPQLTEQKEDIFVYEALVRAETHQRLDEFCEAHDWLQRAYTVIEAHGLSRQRQQADALAARF